jgi:hypothetical protein
MQSPRVSVGGGVSLLRLVMTGHAARRKVTREDDALATRIMFEKFELKDFSKWSMHMKAIPSAYPHTLLAWPAVSPRALASGGRVEPGAAAASVRARDDSRVERQDSR